MKMLVLSRHKDESIIIGDDVEIMIVGIKPGQVKIGIKAPKHVTVHRKEIYEKIQKVISGADKQ
jgi:carbon storage regulator